MLIQPSPFLPGSPSNTQAGGPVGVIKHGPTRLGRPLDSWLRYQGRCHSVGCLSGMVFKVEHLGAGGVDAQ